MLSPIRTQSLARLKRASGLGLQAAWLAAWLAASPGLDQARAQSGAVDTLGGTGTAGLVDGVKGVSEFSGPQGLALRGEQLFVADWGNNLVRAMDLDTTQMRTFAGGNRPVGVVFDRATNLFVANQGDSSIRKYDYFGNQRAFNAQALPANAGEITALAIDRNDNLYIAQRRGVISRMTPAGALDAQYGTPTDGREFRGVAVLDNGTVFASDAASHVIWRFGAPNLFPTVFAGVPNSPGRTFGEPGFGRLDRPHQIAVGPNNTLIVADRGNHQVRVVSCTGVVSLLYGIDPSRWFTVPGLGVYPGWWDSTAEFAELREPTGIAVSTAGVVYDSEGYYHLIRRGQGLSFPACPTQGGGGTTTNAVAPIPVLNPGSGFFPNGTLIEITASNLFAFPRDTKLYYTLDGSAPDTGDTEITIDESGRAFIDLRGTPVDLGLLRVRAFLGASSSPVVAAQPTRVPLPILSPSSGYFPMGATITVTSTNGFPEGTLLYYTTDGTEPTTNSLSLPHDGQRATLSWLEPAKDLRSLRIKAFLGPNVGTTVGGRAVSFPGQPELQGEIGVPESRSGFNAGIGSFYILPVVANLRDQQQLRSIQFVVEVRAGAGAPRLERADVQVLPMSTNDLVQIQPAAVVPPDSTFGTVRDGVNRLAIAYFGTNSGFNVDGFATVAMIGLQMRVQDAAGNRADIGDEYSISVTQVSATSDGAQDLVTLRTMPARTIRLQNISFLEGDSSPAYWYNAGDFGNGVLENGDVNNAVFAAFGFRRPYQGSDVFAAMDVYRVGVLENVIEYNDAATILRRALGFEPANLRRSRNANGEWVQTVAGLMALSARVSAASAATPSSSLAWHRDVLIRGGAVQKAQPGQMVNLPVYMKADSGLSVSGMQFVADVVPSGGAPRVNGVGFTPAGGVPAPALSGSTVPGIGALPETVYARWDNVEPGISGEVLLGHVRFAVPLTADRGQAYAVVLHHAGGATIDPDTGYLRGYLFEAARGQVWVNDTTMEETRDSSDDWKEHFFGSALALEAAAAADSDGDGFSNLEEYLTGTHPGAKDWSARVENGRATFRWVGQAGRKYVVESTEDFRGWNAATGQITGQDAFLEHTEPALSTKARFYRLKVQ